MQKTAHGFRPFLLSPAFWLFAVCAEASAILILSVIPSVEGGMNSGLAAHVLAYATLACTAGMLLMIEKNPWAIVKGALLAALFGCCIELVQYVIPYRSCQLYDVAANCIGALAGMSAAGFAQRRFFGKTPVAGKQEKR